MAEHALIQPTLDQVERFIMEQAVDPAWNDQGNLAEGYYAKGPFGVCGRASSCLIAEVVKKLSGDIFHFMGVYPREAEDGDVPHILWSNKDDPDDERWEDLKPELNQLALIFDQIEEERRATFRSSSQHWAPSRAEALKALHQARGVAQ